jgi:hypothetical protein
MNCTVSIWLGSCGGSVLYGWLRMHSKSGLSLALHRHLCIGLLQLYGSSQLGTVFSCGCPLDFPAFTRVRHRDLVLDISSLRISWTALLWRLMRSLYMFGSVQQSSMCNHVFGWVILHSEQFMLGKSSFQNRCFRAFPMYCPYLNFRSCVIWESVTMGLVQKLLEILLSMRGLLIHLFMLSKFLKSFSFSSFSSFSRYDLRCLIGPLYGWSPSLHHQYGVE